MRENKKRILLFRAVFIVECSMPDKFLTLLKQNGINLYRAEKTDEIHISFETDYINYKKYLNLENLSVNYKTESVKKYGLLTLLPRLKKRLFFIGGFLVCLVSLLFVTGHVWTIEVTGGKFIDKSFVYKVLKDEGFYKGVSKSRIDVREIQNNILMKNPEFSWVWIYIKGTHAVCEIREATPIPEVEDKNTYTNVVASRDGIIMDVMPKKGRQNVEIGDAVKKGDLLIGGISETKYDEIRFLNASGKVYALTYHTKSGEYNNLKQLRYLTGEKTYNLTLNAFGKKIKILKGGENKYKEFDFTEKIHKNSFFNKIYLPISFTSGKYCEIISKYEEISQDEVINTAKDRLYAEIKETLPENTKILSTLCEHTKTKEGNIKVSVTLVCKEDIALVKEIIKPEFEAEENNGENNNT